jgi:hypothetical protein
MIKSRWKLRQWIYSGLSVACCELIQLVRGDWSWGHTFIQTSVMAAAMYWIPSARPFYVQPIRDI